MSSHEDFLEEVLRSQAYIGHPVANDLRYGIRGPLYGPEEEEPSSLARESHWRYYASVAMMAGAAALITMAKLGAVDTPAAEAQDAMGPIVSDSDKVQLDTAEPSTIPLPVELTPSSTPQPSSTPSAESASPSSEPTAPLLMPPIETALPPVIPESVVTPVAIRVMAWNVLGASHTDPHNANHAEYANSATRTKIVVDEILKRKPDLIALSELEPRQLRALLDNPEISKLYDVFPKNPDYGTDSNMSVNSIFAKKDRFIINDTGGRSFEYFSPGVNQMPWIQLQDIDNMNYKIAFTGLHDPANTARFPNNTEKRDRNADRHVDWTKEQLKKGYEVVMTGDLNSGAVVRDGIDKPSPAELPCREMTAGDVLDDIYDVSKGGDGDCQTAAKHELKPIIDRGFTSKGLSARNWKFIKTNDVLEASDHGMLLFSVEPTG